MYYDKIKRDGFVCDKENWNYIDPRLEKIKQTPVDVQRIKLIDCSNEITDLMHRSPRTIEYEEEERKKEVNENERFSKRYVSSLKQFED